MGKCFFCKDGSCEECLASFNSKTREVLVSSSVNFKEGDLASLMREYTEVSVQLANLKSEFANYKREVDLREYDTYHRRISDLESENVNLRLNQAPKLADQVAMYQSTCQMLEKNVASFRKDLVLANGELTNKNLQLAYYAKEIVKLKHNLAVLKGEQPSLITRVIALLKSIVGYNLVGDLFRGIKVTILFILSCCWFAFTLPTSWMRMYRKANLDCVNDSGSKFFMENCALAAVLIILLLSNHVGKISLATWLPNIVQCCGLQLSPYLNFTQKLWLVSHFGVVVSSIYWLFAITNGLSLIIEIGRATKKNSI